MKGKGTTLMAVNAGISADVRRLRDNFCHAEIATYESFLRVFFGMRFQDILLGRMDMTEFLEAAEDLLQAFASYFMSEQRRDFSFAVFGLRAARTLCIPIEFAVNIRLAQTHICRMRQGMDRLLGGNHEEAVENVQVLVGLVDILKRRVIVIAPVEGVFDPVIVRLREESAMNCLPITGATSRLGSLLSSPALQNALAMEVEYSLAKQRAGQIKSEEKALPLFSNVFKILSDYSACLVGQKRSSDAAPSSESDP